MHSRSSQALSRRPPLTTVFASSRQKSRVALDKLTAMGVPRTAVSAASSQLVYGTRRSYPAATEQQPTAMISGDRKPWSSASCGNSETADHGPRSTSIGVPVTPISHIVTSAASSQSPQFWTHVIPYRPTRRAP